MERIIESPGTGRRDSFSSTYIPGSEGVVEDSISCRAKLQVKNAARKEMRDRTPAREIRPKVGAQTCGMILICHSLARSCLLCAPAPLLCSGSGVSGRWSLFFFPHLTQLPQTLPILPRKVWKT